MPDFKLFDRSRNCALAAGLTVAIGLTSAASAQGAMNFFGFFSGVGNNWFQTPPPVRQPVIRRSSHVRRRTGGHQQVAETKHRHHWTSSNASIASSSPAYCVRLCDGRYFQLAISTPDKANSLCGLACPDAAAQVFFGDGGINDAATADGQRYNALPNAFAYRSHLVADCSCRSGSPGMAPVSIEEDPTLDQGDIVMTQQGPIVFQGTENQDRRPNFTPISNYREIESKVRRYLTTLPVDGEH